MSDANGYPIRKLTVAAFMDADKVKARVHKIASNSTAANSLRSKANSLLNEWEDDTKRDY